MRGQEQGFRLSAQQRRLWLLQQDSQVYSVHSAVLVEGALRPDMLRDALGAVVARHEILRTTFRRVAAMKMPLQVIAPTASLLWRGAEASEQQSGEQADRIAELFVQHRRQLFDLEHGPLLHATLLTLAPQRHMLFLGLPALCADAQSLKNLVSELSRAYLTGACGEGAEDEIVQYVEFSEWHNELLAGPDGQEGIAYWRRQHAAPPVASALPFENNRTTPADFAPEVFEAAGDRTLIETIDAAAQRQHTSAALLLLACWAMLLSRLTGDQDVVVGYTLDNRESEELRDALGPFAQSVPIHCHVEPDVQFDEILAQLQQTVSNAATWQLYYVFEPPAASTENVAPIPNAFAFDDRTTCSTADDLRFSIVGQFVCTERFKVKLACTRSPDSIVAAFYYDPAMIPEEAVRCLAEQFYTLVKSACTHPSARVDRLQMLGEAEHRRLIYEFNHTASSYPSDQCVHHLFEQQAERSPQQIAAVYNDQRLTYAELNARANQLAHHLQTRGIGPDTLVAICIERSIDMLVGVLGILKAGAAYVPLDPSLPRERLSFILQDIRAPLLLTATTDDRPTTNDEGQGDKETRRQGDRAIYNLQSTIYNLPEQRTTDNGQRTPDDPSSILHPLPSVVDLCAHWPTIAQQPTTCPDQQVRPENLAYVMYTSGSTGAPKGVMIPHRGLVNYLTWCLSTYPVAEGQGAPVHSPIGFDLTVTSLFAPLLAARPVVLLDEELGVEALTTVLGHDADFSLVKVTPSHLGVLNQLMLADQAAGSTRALIIGGEALRWESLDFWRRHAPHTRLFNEYGPTEAVVGCCVYEVQPGARRYAGVPIGRPIANTQIYLLDEHLQPVPTGVPGALHIGGDGLARGYLNHPDLTAERFIPNPFLKDEGLRMKDEGGRFILHPSSFRLYRTGDLARYLPDGAIEFIGRVDHQVKIRGFRVELGEIEMVLRQHPAVQDAAVLAHEDMQGQRRLVAYVVPKIEDGGWKIEDRQPGASETPSSILHPPASSLNELRAFLKDRLPEYMLPSAFMPLTALPLTSNGKVDRRALLRLDEQVLKSKRPYVAPRTPVEQQLADIWAQVLKLDQVGIHDNFFEIGGDSILSIQVVSRAGAAAIQLTPRQLFQHRTIAELAAVAGAPYAPQAEQGLVTGAASLTPIQRWFFDRPMAEPNHWNQALLLSVRQPVDSAALELGIQRLLEHHDALRIRFTRDSGGWRQCNAGLDEHVPFTVVDLSACAAAEQARALEAAAADLQASLDLANGPLLRAAFFDHGPHAPGRLLLIAHHLVVDGVSWRILIEDLQTAYEQLSSGQEIALPPKTTAFIHWARRLAEYTQSDALTDELGYWLAASPPAARLAVDYDAPDDANIEASARTVTTLLSAEATEALLREVPGVYRTEIIEVLLTALTQALTPWIGAPSLWIDLEGHGREEIAGDVNLSRTVGWFTALFPIHLRLDEGAAHGVALKAIKEQMRRIPRGGIGYGLLRYLCEDAGVAARLREAPRPQISFNYLGQLDQVLARSARFGPASAPIGAGRGGRNQRSHLLEISGFVRGGQLAVEWTYSVHVHRHTTIEGLAQRYLGALQALIAHCQSPEAGGYTPSDFPSAGLNQAELDQLLASLKP